MRLHARSRWARTLLCAVCATMLAVSAVSAERGTKAQAAASGCPISLRSPCITPAQDRAAYDLLPLYQRGITGKGRTIAIIDSFGSPSIRADLTAFDRAFGLPDPSLTILAPFGAGHDSGSGWNAETSLDVEWAHVIAPEARIVLLESPVDETEGVQGLPQFLSLERYVLAHRLADVISQSWSATEDTLLDPPGRDIVQRFHRFYQAAAKAGVSVVGSSGDLGTAGLDLSLKHFFPFPTSAYPTTDPSVLSVGGTTLNVDATGATKEVAWAGSSGGYSKLFAEPAYQHMLSKPLQLTLKGRRGVPDVAFNAAKSSAVPIVVQGRWKLAWGTSAGAPQWAALVALADQAAGRDLGIVNTILYRIAASSRYAADFHDITSGMSVGPIEGGTALGNVGFHAAPGWDPVTGLGTPRAAALIPDIVAFSKQPGG